MTFVLQFREEEAGGVVRADPEGGADEVIRPAVFATAPAVGRSSGGRRGKRC